MKSAHIYLSIISFLTGFIYAQAPQFRRIPEQDVKVAQMPNAIAQQTMALSSKFLLLGKELNDQSKKLPLVITLHGGGGHGNDPMRIKGPAMSIYSTAEHLKQDCIVVAPQCLREQRGGKGPGQAAGQRRGGWFASDLDIFLAYLKENYPIDTTRIYLTGNSMGGYGTYHWAGNSPQHFAALLPIVGGIGEQGPRDISPHLSKWAKNIASIPMKTFYGADDKVVPPEMGKKMISEIKKHGGKKAKLIIFENEGHAASRKVMTNKEYFKWLFAQKK